MEIAVAMVTGKRLRVTGYKLRVTGYGLQVKGYGLQVAGCRGMGDGFRVVGGIARQLDLRCRLLIKPQVVFEQRMESCLISSDCSGVE